MDELIEELAELIGEQRDRYPRLCNDMDSEDLARAVVEHLGLGWEVRDEVGYGVLVGRFLVSTYDGSARKHTRRVAQTPWREAS